MFLIIIDIDLKRCILRYFESFYTSRPSFPASDSAYKLFTEPKSVVEALGAHLIPIATQVRQNHRPSTLSRKATIDDIDIGYIEVISR